jgi:NADPH:quinone reductase-like Zn-dependent oxidoreductase
MAANQFRQWVIASTTGVDGLQLSRASIPEIGLDDVLVEFRSVSLNYRDIIILNVSTSPVHCGHSQ